MQNPNSMKGVVSMGLLYDITKPMYPKGTKVRLTKQITTKHGNILPAGTDMVVAFSNPLLRLYDLEYGPLAALTLYGIEEDAVTIYKK